MAYDPDGLKSIWFQTSGNWRMLRYKSGGSMILITFNNFDFVPSFSDSFFAIFALKIQCHFATYFSPSYHPIQSNFVTLLEPFYGRFWNQITKKFKHIVKPAIFPNSEPFYHQIYSHFTDDLKANLTRNSEPFCHQFCTQIQRHFNTWNSFYNQIMK